MSEKNPWLEPGEPARPTDIKSDKADLDMRLERKALAEGWDRTADKLDTALSQLAALREELAQAAHMRTFWAESAAELDKRLADAERRNAALSTALKFYSDCDHLLLADPDEWDTCSGEPVNWLHDSAGTASVEDGSVARAALNKFLQDELAKVGVKVKGLNQ